jgi:FkbM family methyltransferase
MRPQHILGKFHQLLHLPWSCWFPFVRGWLQRGRTGFVPCAFPGAKRLVQVPLKSFYESYRFSCEVAQGTAEMKFFLGKLRAGDVLFDVGAFYGAFGAAAKAVFGDSVQIHAFEPVAENLCRIVEVCERNGFDSFSVIPKAVGSGAPISGTVDAEDGMLRRRDGMLRQEDNGSADTSAEFPSISIDAHVREAGVVPTVIKIDVEGFEADVLEGARNTLRDHHPRIWLEVHPNFLSEQGKDWQGLVQSLKALGYKVAFSEDYDLSTRDIAFHIWCETE